MEFLAATFDHAHPGSRGDYWAYAHPDLETAVLDRLYFEVVAPSLRDHPEWAGLSELSGFATLGPRWACWFKRFDVGNDLKGRPGRFVIACGFFDRSAALGQDSNVALAAPHFTDTQQLARKHCPLPQPASLSFVVECRAAEPAEPLRSELGKKQSCQWHGPDALSQLGRVVAANPLSEELRAFAWEVAGQTTVRAVLVRQSAPKPEAVVVQNPPPRTKPVLLPQSVPGASPIIRDQGFSQRRAFAFFVAGLLVGLGFGFWFGQRNGSATTNFPPDAEHSTPSSLDRTKQNATNNHSTPKRP